VTLRCRSFASPDDAQRQSRKSLGADRTQRVGINSGKPLKASVEIAPETVDAIEVVDELEEHPCAEAVDSPCQMMTPKSSPRLSPEDSAGIYSKRL
jgi:hypothetical protein